MGIGIVMTCCLFGLSAVGCIEDNSTVNKTDDPNVSLFECRDGLEYDMCMYLENLTQVEGGWEDDGAFIPTITTFAFTFCVGITGNLLVLFALLGDRKARNVTSSFLVSLAIADLVFLCICVPYEVGIKMRKEWVAGEAVCKLFGFIEMLSAAASVLNLTAVSVERYVVIVHPMKSRTWCTMGNTKKIIIGVWVIAVLLSLPVLHIMAAHAMYYYNNYTSVVVGTCSSTGGNSDEERIIIAWYQFLVLFIAPVVVMNFCYAYVIHVLWISTKELAKLTHTNRKAHKKRPLQKAVNQSCIEDESKRLTHSPNRPVTKTIITRAVKDHSLDVKEARKQVIKMLLTIIGVFFMCWGPKMILNILKVHQWQVLHKDESFYATLPINLLPYIQSCTNPLIYSFMSNNFRRSMRNACRARCHVCFRIARACTRSRQSEFDMETKSVNGTSKYSPTSVSNARAGRTIYTSVVSEC